MIKSERKLESLIKRCPHSLSNREISDNDRVQAMENKKTFDDRHLGKTGKLVKIGKDKWKEVWE